MAIKILFVIPSLRGGGAEKVVLEVLRNLDRKKFQPELAVLTSEGEYQDLVPKDIKFFDLKKRSAKYAIFSLAKLVNKEKPDIILGTVEQIIILSYLIKFFLKTKPIIINRCSNFFSIKTTNKFIKFLESLALRNSDYVISVSKGVREDLIKNFKVKKEKIKLIYNPVEIKKVKKLAKEQVKEYFKKRPVILSCGRLKEEKGFPFLIKAFEMILKKFPKITLLVLGQGEKEKELKLLTKKLKIEDKVKFLGFSKNPFKYMARADVFVLSSLCEGMPGVLLEAIGCGTPVVSSDCKSGPREILAPDTDFNFQTKSVEFAKYGVLVPPQNSELLAEGILKLLKDSNLIKKYYQLGRERVKDFSIEKIIKQYENFFLEITKNYE